jgi:hypothetical protein
MALVTRRLCDRCKQEFPPEETFHVKAQIARDGGGRIHPRVAPYDFGYITWEQDWCMGCAKEMGFDVIRHSAASKPSVTGPANAPSVEAAFLQAFRDWLAEEVPGMVQP